VPNALKVVMVEPYRTGRPLGKNLPHAPGLPATPANGTADGRRGARCGNL
jgi:hypothetical protein